ncbi:MAG TPA: hypothetical protein VJN96_03000 [Vicinamibacterales bacterium]|nr:hypothetical protein [Vicinamibacterales bacterium]
MTRGGIARALALVALISIAWAAAIWIAGGRAIVIGGLRLSSSSVWRPLAIAIVAAALSAVLAGAQGTRAMAAAVTRTLTPSICALAFALVTAVVSLAGNSWTASGPDSFAYVSQAAMWRAGQLDTPVPLAADAPWPNAVATFSPFGYRPAPNGRPALVPVTAPGLPLAMAALQSVGGHAAAFVITPMAGGALVWLTFAIGRRVRSPATGLIAAWLVATSPALLFMLMWPMTDVPAAACAALLVLLLLGSSPPSALAAGLTASAGLLLRPNFFLIAGAAVLWLIVEALGFLAGPGRWRRVVMYVVGAVPGAVFMAWLNARWYGGVAASGYGTASELFSLARIPENLFRYGGWLIETSPLALIGIVALLVPIARLWPRPSGLRASLLCAIVAAGACAVYLAYEPYDAWWYLRFLLPAWSAIFVAAAVALAVWRERGRASAVMVFAIVVVAGTYGVATARQRGVFEIGPTERRYVTVARIVDEHTEPSAVILTSAHSGTVRYYAGRVTLRFDVLDPAWLDRAVAWLEARGRHPYILLEDWEAPIFSSEFRGASPLADLAFAPIVAWESSRIRGAVFLYDPLKRAAITMTPPPDFERAQPRAAPASRLGAFPKTP